MNSVPGTAPEAYRQVAQSLEALPVPVELPRLFQVDSLRPAGALTLSRRVTREILDSLEALRHFASRAPEGDVLVRFRERFAERYETRAVPLLEALDDERGVGLKNETRLGASTSPLLQGLPFQGRKGQERTRLSKRWSLLQRRLEETWRERAHELVLTPEDVATLDPEESAVLPDAFGVLGTLVAPSAEAVDRGEFQFVLEHAHGPSGAMMLGRFSTIIRRSRPACASMSAPRSSCARMPSSRESSTCRRTAWATSSAGPRCASMTSSSWASPGSPWSSSCAWRISG